jgi:plastocyanin
MLAATLLVTGVLTTTACSKGGQRPQATGEPAGSEASPTAAPSQPAAPAGPVTIKLVNQAIEQPAVTVAKGTKIVWSNTETNGVPHNIVSGTIQGTTAQPDGLFASAALFNPGQSFEHTFASAGTFPYYCSVHPEQMKGTVTVS